MGEQEPLILRSDVRPVSAYPKREIVWLSPGRLARGKLTMLDGDPGLGKSTLTIDWAARISTGRPLPDGDPAEAQGVLLLSAEDAVDDTIRPRLEVAGADLDRVFIMRMLDQDENEYEPSLPKHIHEVEAQIITRDIALVVVDPFMAFLNEEINANRDQEIRRGLSPVGSLAERTGAAFLFLRHLNKALGGSPLYRGGGSIGIIGAARSGLLVTRDPDDRNMRVLASQKSNLAFEPTSLSWSLEAVPGTGVARVVYHGVSQHTAEGLLGGPNTDEERSALVEAKEWLHDQLKHGPVLVKELQKQARDAAHSWRTVERAKSALGAQATKVGFADGAWRWILPLRPPGGAWRTSTEDRQEDRQGLADSDPNTEAKIDRRPPRPPNGIGDDPDEEKFWV